MQKMSHFFQSFRHLEFELISKAKCYQPLEIIVDKKFNPVSIINLGFIVGSGLNTATGAMMKLEYDSYNLELCRQLINI